MAATVLNYTRKDPDLEVIKFDTSSTESMEDAQDWVIANLLVASEVTLRTSMGGSLFWEGTIVYPNEYIAKDSNGKLIKMTKDDLDKFFDEVVV